MPTLLLSDMLAVITSIFSLSLSTVALQAQHEAVMGTHVGNQHTSAG